MGSQPMVLVAKLDDGRTLYAVEREDRGLYVLCQLGSWIDLQQLKAAAVALKKELPKSSDKYFGFSADLQDSKLAPLVTPESSKYSKKKRLAIEAIQSMVKRPSTGLLEESQPSTTEPEPLLESHNEVPVSNIPLMDEVETQPTATEIFENVRNQYFEILYLSKAGFSYPNLQLKLTCLRPRWLISPKDHYHEPVRHSTSIMTQHWI
jgi:DNA replication regulator SLD3